MFALGNLRQLIMSHNCLTEINGELNDLVMLEVLVSPKHIELIDHKLFKKHWFDLTAGLVVQSVDAFKRWHRFFGAIDPTDVVAQ